MASAKIMGPRLSKQQADILRADPFGLQPDAPAAVTSEDVAALFAAQGQPPVPSLEQCTGCGGSLHCGIDGQRLTCNHCGLVVDCDSTEPDEDAPRLAPGAARLKLVGVGSSSLQPDLYRSCSGDSSVSQKRQILDEFLMFRQKFIERGGSALPINALVIATDYYHEVQEECVKRSQNKRKIMAACIAQAGLDIGFLPTKIEIADFMQLPNSGIAPGVNFLRSLTADGKMSIDVHTDPWKPARAEISTLFAHLNIGQADVAPLREAILDVVKFATSENIGTSSFLRSKVAGATYAVLRRAALSDGGLLGAAGHSAVAAVAAQGLQLFCGDRIRKNTVERFLRELDDYHSKFEAVYAAHGIDARRGVVSAK